jgi:signal transduction histidine kinase
MTDSVRVVIARVMASIAVAGAIVGLVWLVVLGYSDILWSDWVVHNAVLAVGSGLIAWMVSPSQPRNGEIWVFAWGGLFTGLLCLLYAVAAQILTVLAIDTPVMEIIPSTIPTHLAIVLMFVNFLWVGIFFPFTLGLVLFPDGKPPSPRWRWLVWLLIATIAALCIGLFWEARPSSTFTLMESQDTNGGFRSITSAMASIAYVALFALVLATVSAVVVRFRRSVGVERQQFRWVVWGAAISGLLMLSAVVLDEVGGRLDLALAAGAVAMATIMTSFGIAIGKYRLYDIDVVISRTLVYGILALFIGLVYVGFVVGVGYAIGAHDEPNPVLGVLATVLIAISFQPLRRRLQRLANRVVYGRRATPYQVLSEFAQKISAVDPDVLTQVARSLAEGTTANGASISVLRDGMMRRVAGWPEGIGEGDGSPVRVAPVVQDGDELGAVTIYLSQGQPFGANDSRLLYQVAAGLGLALRNMLLTEDLRARVEELRASRRRIVTVQDDTRRKLERDLHDGAQQRLVALKIKLGLGAAMADKAGIRELGTMLGDLKTETDMAIDSVREFARGIYPPLLEAEGLGPALVARARRMPVPTTIQAAGLGRYPKEQEATIYFCVLEALQNAMKHARGSSVQVSLTERDGSVVFEVRDDGVGFDPMSSGGNGLTNMTDRVEAVGGELSVESRPGAGTLISGRIPVLEMATS